MFVLALMVGTQEGTRNDFGYAFRQAVRGPRIFVFLLHRGPALPRDHLLAAAHARTCAARHVPLAAGVLADRGRR